MYHKIGNVEKIINIFHSLGFNDEQILKLVANKKSYICRLDQIETSFAYYHQEMKKRNYTEEEIYELATNYPNAIFYRFYHGIMKKEYISFIENYRKENSKEKSNIDLQGTTKILKSVGVSQKKLDDIYTFNCSILWIDKKTLKDNIAFHKKCGISPARLKANANSYPRILELGEEELSDLLEKMISLNMTNKDLGRLLTTCAKFKIKLNQERFIANLKWAQAKGLNLDKLGKNITKSNVFVGTKTETLENDFNELVKLGLSEDEVRKIVSSTPSTLTMDKSMLAYTMNILIHFGMSEEEMIHVITEYSAIFTLSLDNIINKFRVLRDYNLIWYIVKKPKNLIQSAELTEARAAYLNSYYNYDEINFARYVFMGEKAFISMFNINNENVKRKKVLQKV